MTENESERLEVKVFWETDVCEFCEAIQGGYIDEDDDRHINIRDGRDCYSCQQPETF